MFALQLLQVGCCYGLYIGMSCTEMHGCTCNLGPVELNKNAILGQTMCGLRSWLRCWSSM
jgi:hypothetical protein